MGLSGGLMTISYVVGIMSSYLIAEFGWAKSDMALIGALALGAVLIFPFVGRLTDVVGVRKTALVGIIGSPLLFLACSMMHDIRVYAFIFTLQASVLATTTPPVYCRAIVQNFNRARGLALGIATAGPAVTVAIGGPLLNNFVADHGWRAGYIALAIFTAITGLATFLLLPNGAAKHAEKRAKPKTARQDYAKIFRAPAFWLMFIAILLCNLPQSVMMSQFSLVLQENGVSGKAASLMISFYATGMLLGRIVSGVSLDRFPARGVAVVGHLLSGIGLLVIASGFDARPVLLIAVLVVGLSLGAEGDVVAYLVVRNFGVRIYSSVHSLLAATVAIAAVLGSLLLSVILKVYFTFAPFLMLTGILVLIGSALFLLLPRNPVIEDELSEDEIEPEGDLSVQKTARVAPA
jgi:predicted MFS family arabinose efflux permease